MQQQFAIRESESESGVIRRVPKLKDPIAERVRTTVMRLLKEHRITEQKELVALCASPFVRADQVHKLWKGDLQFPPLSFFDTVLRALGSSLRDALADEPVTVKPLPIRRDDVLELARLLERLSPTYVQSAKNLAEETLHARSRGRTGGSQRGGA